MLQSILGLNCAESYRTVGYHDIEWCKQRQQFNSFWVSVMSSYVYLLKKINDQGSINLPAPPWYVPKHDFIIYGLIPAREV